MCSVYLSGSPNSYRPYTTFRQDVSQLQGPGCRWKQCSVGIAWYCLIRNIWVAFQSLSRAIVSKKTKVDLCVRSRSIDRNYLFICNSGMELAQRSTRWAELETGLRIIRHIVKEACYHIMIIVCCETRAFVVVARKVTQDCVRWRGTPDQSAQIEQQKSSQFGCNKDGLSDISGTESGVSFEGNNW